MLISLCTWFLLILDLFLNLFKPNKSFCQSPNNELSDNLGKVFFDRGFRVMHFLQLHESDYEKTRGEFDSKWKSFGVLMSNGRTNICVNRPDRKLWSEIAASLNRVVFLSNRLPCHKRTIRRFTHRQSRMQIKVVRLHDFK